MIIMLRAARDVISNPDNWCQRASAVDACGIVVASTWDTACSWCAFGALVKTCNSFSSPEFKQLRKLLEVEMGMPMASFNDSHTHAEVLQKFDNVIHRIENEQTRTS